MPVHVRGLAFYGKGGIGKSTVVSNLAAALSEHRVKVLVVGCDPKADCTKNLLGGRPPRPLMDYLRSTWGGSDLGDGAQVLNHEVSVEELENAGVLRKGFGGVSCIEVGGPEPGVGCAGRGILLGLELLRRWGVFEQLKPDIVLYDVPGDIVCGGLALPLRKGVADLVYVVTSSEYLPLYAANNLCKAIRRYATRGGSKLGGLVYNARGYTDDPELVEEFAKRLGSEVVARVPWSPLIPQSEAKGMTVIEYAPDSQVAHVFRELARKVLSAPRGVVPTPMSDEELLELVMGRHSRWRPT